MAKIKLGEFRSKESALVSQALLDAHGIESSLSVDDVAGMYPAIGGIDGRPSSLYIDEAMLDNARAIIEAEFDSSEFKEYWDLNHPDHIDNIDTNKRRLSNLDRAFYASVLGLAIFFLVFQLASIYWLIRSILAGEVRSQADRGKFVLTCILNYVGLKLFISLILYSFN